MVAASSRNLGRFSPGIVVRVATTGITATRKAEGVSIRPLSACERAARKHNAASEEVRGFREFLDHLDALTRNTVKVINGTTEEYEILSTPTPIQRRVCELLGAAVPLRLTKPVDSAKLAYFPCWDLGKLAQGA